MDTIVDEKHWSEVYFLPNADSLMTQKQKDEMHEEVYGPILKYQKEVRIGNLRLIRAIKIVKGDTFARNLKRYLKDLTDGCDHVENMKYEMVTKTTGAYQKEDWGREIKGVWCDQQSVGCEGDSYEGYVYIEITKGRYLRVNYSM